MAKKTAKAPWATPTTIKPVVGRMTSKESNLKPKKAGMETVTVTVEDNTIARSFESPTSSNILGASYVPATKDLIVKFHGGRSYLYTGVPRDLWDDFDAAESKGQFFAARIRNKGFGEKRL